MTTLDSALALAKEGRVPVWLHGINSLTFACTCGDPACAGPGKRPYLKEWTTLRPTQDDLVEWYTLNPESNLGVLTGKPSNLVVLDLDPRNGGTETFQKLPPIPETRVVRTGGDGFHYWFSYPNGGAVIQSAKLGPGLELLSDGRQAVAPPSLHRSGGVYQWVNEGAPLAPLPDFLYAASIRSTEKPYETPEVKIGERHNYLLKWAGLFRRYGMSDAEIFGALRELNKRCAPPMSDSDLLTIARSMEKYPPDEKAVAVIGQTSDTPEKPVSDTAYADAAILASNLYDMDIPKPVSILGDGLLVVGTTGIIYGPSGIGKSFIAMELSISVARGEPWFGIPTTQAGSGFIALEIPRYFLQQRIRALSPDSRHGLDRLALLARDDIPSALNLADAACIPLIVNFLQRHNLRFFVVDTLARAQIGDVSNDADVIPVLNNLDLITRATNSAALLVHHDRKGAPGKKNDSGLDTLRGSQILNGHPNLHIHVGDDKGKVQITTEKANFGKEPDPIWLDRLESGRLVVSEKPDDPSKRYQANLAETEAWIRLQTGEFRVSDAHEILELKSSEGTLVGVKTVQRYLETLSEKGVCRLVRPGKPLTFARTL